LADGFAFACRESNAVWGGGETPALKGIVTPESIVLAGSAVGRVTPKTNRITGDVEDGDAIIFLASTGVQTNGLTLCRALADRLPEGYLTKIDGRRTYGEALLDASAIYVKFVAALQHAKLQPKYLAHVTGHGWRKLMRLAEPFVYRIETVRDPLAIFQFIESAGEVTRQEMYGTFNMGIGFAAYVAPEDADRCVQIATDAGYDAWRAGTVVKAGERKAVEILPLGLIYEGETLKLR
jgi:phosphoribosylformylglycinamidine cyclo-ligase